MTFVTGPSTSDTGASLARLSSRSATSSWRRPPQVLFWVVTGSAL